MRQRYRCDGCGRTFSDFTGTALCGLRRADLWPEFCRCVLDGLTVRQAAARLGVHRDTAFRWRHRLLQELRAAETHPLGPIVRVGETAVYGRHWLLLALDDRARAGGGRVGGRRARAEDLDLLLEERFERRCLVVTTEGPFGAAARFADARGLSWQRRRPVDMDLDPMIEPISVYGRRFRWWLRRFRGVSGRYLDNYLAWFRLHDCSIWNGVLPGPRRRQDPGVGLRVSRG